MDAIYGTWERGIKHRILVVMGCSQAHDIRGCLNITIVIVRDVIPQWFVFVPVRHMMN